MLPVRCAPGKSFRRERKRMSADYAWIVGAEKPSLKSGGCEPGIDVVVVGGVPGAQPKK